ncbi:hypothetical protein D0864_09789 [Hortaea werneckii]|uniref:Uncharacterized protein n=1 Tax=Hortaea werneckii TaxID=91943 RepID=A0A3M7EGU4_HORWE|nr:hypothetical protein D0864_09789 [Hortaea werneckii]RMZ18647.1 hypothetical protein D0862_00080 [Hortaea werneckii]
MPSVRLREEQYSDVANVFTGTGVKRGGQEDSQGGARKQVRRTNATGKDNPNHPAHKDHPKHHEFLKSIPQRLGGAAIFGAGATAGADLVNSIIH